MRKTLDKRARALVFAAVFLMWALITVPAGAEEGPEDPAVLTPAYLYNFAKFVEWPESLWVGTEAPFVIGVAGNEETARALAVDLTGRTVHGRPVACRHLREVGELKSCQLIWMGGTTPERQAEILAALRGSPVLTVGPGAEFARAGGMIGLFVESDRLRFAVNRWAATRCGLRVSSKLLSLAVLVNEEAAR